MSDFFDESDTAWVPHWLLQVLVE